jgi:hypothetical protein
MREYEYARPKRPRRSRHEAIVSRNGETETRYVRAYGVDDARAYYEARGYIVHDVRKPPTTGTVEWKLNQPAVDEAIAFLGIKLPVTIKQTRRTGSQKGAHTMRPEGPGIRVTSSGIVGLRTAERAAWSHRITAKSYLSPAEASAVLWHELTHAMQAERVIASLPADASPIDIYNAHHSAYFDGTAYTRKPWEIEANEFAASFADELPLARAA